MEELYNYYKILMLGVNDRVIKYEMPYVIYKYPIWLIREKTKLKIDFTLVYKK